MKFAWLAVRDQVMVPAVGSGLILKGLGVALMYGIYLLFEYLVVWVSIAMIAAMFWMDSL